MAVMTKADMAEHILKSEMFGDGVISKIVGMGQNPVYKSIPGAKITEHGTFIPIKQGVGRYQVFFFVPEKGDAGYVLYDGGEKRLIEALVGEDDSIAQELLNRAIVLNKKEIRKMAPKK